MRMPSAVRTQIYIIVSQVFDKVDRNFIFSAAELEKRTLRMRKTVDIAAQNFYNKIGTDKALPARKEHANGKNLI